MWTLTRSSILIWALSGLLTGALATTLTSVVASMGSDNPGIAKIITSLTQGGSLAEGTVVIFFTMLGVLASCCAVQVMLRARQEETHGTVELVWAAPVGRRQFLGGYLARGTVGILATILAGVLGAVLGMARSGIDATILRDIWVVSAGQAVAAAVFLGIAAVLVVLVPRVSIAASWAVVMLGMILGFFGPIFGLPHWLSQVSPVAVAPTVRPTGIDLQGLPWLILVIVITVGLALWLVRRRPLVTE